MKEKAQPCSGEQGKPFDWIDRNAVYALERRLGREIKSNECIEKTWTGRYRLVE